jgi:hypothetical protein
MNYGIEDLAKYLRYYHAFWTGRSAILDNMSCPSCMIGKSTLEDLPKLKTRAMEPLVQVNMDIFLSSVQSIKGYNFAVVFVDCTT